MIKTVIHGAGRMAQGVLALLPEHPEFELLALVSRTEPKDLLATQALTSSSTGTAPWLASLQDISAEVDLLIDFTLPGGPGVAAQWCRKNAVAMLSGTTGLSAEDKAALQQASSDIPVLWASNLSQGIALMTALVRQAATVLGERADFTISDIHHQYKVDAPSGTALTLADAVMEGRNAYAASNHSGHAAHPDQDNQADEHEDNEIAFISVRKDEVIGNHTVSLELPGEIIEISHQACDRSVFAQGALNAGAWLSTQKPGYYSTADWLNIG